MPPQASSKPIWLAVKTKPKQEERARQNLEQQAFTVYLPKITATKRLRGHWQKVVEPLFPGYLFIHLDPDHVSLSPVRSTLGVYDLVRFGQRLVPIPDTVIDFLRHNEQQSAVPDTTPPVPFTTGDTVQLLTGAFAGLPAVFQMTKGQDRAMLLISLLGGTNLIDVPLDHIAPL